MDSLSTAEATTWRFDLYLSEQLRHFAEYFLPQSVREVSTSAEPHGLDGSGVELRSRACVGWAPLGQRPICTHDVRLYIDLTRGLPFNHLFGPQFSRTSIKVYQL